MGIYTSSYLGPLCFFSLIFYSFWPAKLGHILLDVDLHLNLDFIQIEISYFWCHLKQYFLAMLIFHSVARLQTCYWPLYSVFLSCNFAMLTISSDRFFLQTFSIFHSLGFLPEGRGSVISSFLICMPFISFFFLAFLHQQRLL